MTIPVSGTSGSERNQELSITSFSEAPNYDLEAQAESGRSARAGNSMQPEIIQEGSLTHGITATKTCRIPTVSLPRLPASTPSLISSTVGVGGIRNSGGQIGRTTAQATRPRGLSIGKAGESRVYAYPVSSLTPASAAASPTTPDTPANYHNTSGFNLGLAQKHQSQIQASRVPSRSRSFSQSQAQTQPQPPFQRQFNILEASATIKIPTGTTRGTQSFTAFQTRPRSHSHSLLPHSQLQSTACRSSAPFIPTLLPLSPLTDVDFERDFDSETTTTTRSALNNGFGNLTISTSTQKDYTQTCILESHSPTPPATSPVVSTPSSPPVTPPSVSPSGFPNSPARASLHQLRTQRGSVLSSSSPLHHFSTPNLQPIPTTPSTNSSTPHSDIDTIFDDITTVPAPSMEAPTGHRAVGSGSGESPRTLSPVERMPSLAVSHFPSSFRLVFLDLVCTYSRACIRCDQSNSCCLMLTLAIGPLHRP